jgi:hypothetical protein
MTYCSRSFISTFSLALLCSLPGFAQHTRERAIEPPCFFVLETDRAWFGDSVGRDIDAAIAQGRLKFVSQYDRATDSFASSVCPAVGLAIGAERKQLIDFFDATVSPASVQAQLKSQWAQRWSEQACTRVAKATEGVGAKPLLSGEWAGAASDRAAIITTLEATKSHLNEIADAANDTLRAQIRLRYDQARAQGLSAINACIAAEEKALASTEKKP